MACTTSESLFLEYIDEDTGYGTSRTIHLLPVAVVVAPVISALTTMTGAERIDESKW
jgi:hypothetical protein